jgi:type IV pilus assembly protein PilP
MNMRALLFAIAGLASGCASSAPSEAKVPPKAPEVKKPAEEKPAEAAPEFEYVYSPVGKRDPFRSTLDEMASSPSESASTSQICGPLCRWELEQLKLVAVISGVSNPLAMVEDPKGDGYVVRRGTLIGKRNGKVTQIRSGELVVNEIYKDQTGKSHVSPVVIKLPVDKTSEEEDPNLLGPESAE